MENFLSLPDNPLKNPLLSIFALVLCSLTKNKNDQIDFYLHSFSALVSRILRKKPSTMFQFYSISIMFILYNKVSNVDVVS